MVLGHHALSTATLNLSEDLKCAHVSSHRMIYMRVVTLAVCLRVCVSATQHESKASIPALIQVVHPSAPSGVWQLCSEKLPADVELYATAHNIRTSGISLY